MNDKIFVDERLIRQLIAHLNRPSAQRKNSPLQPDELMHMLENMRQLPARK